MASQSNAKEVQAYPPTSLDFINRPNPVEPLAAPPKHPLHGAGHLHNAYTHDLRRLLLNPVPRDAEGEAAAKRARRDKDGPGHSNSSKQVRDLPSLPKLPNRSAGGSKERRRRLPPTLSGLHQPPPNAGLLPSMSVQQPGPLSTEAHGLAVESRNIAPTTISGAQSHTGQSIAEKTVAKQSDGKAKSGKPGKNKWSDEETADLLKGVARFGIGSWTKILKCEDYSFNRRTALDLKDRFRVCCPEHYRKPKSLSQTPQDSLSLATKKQPKPNDRKGASELAQLGIEEPFQKSGRRSRHGYTKDQDEALLRGFRKHGKSWAAIQKDERALSDRTSTDLRDRFRLRYPDEYAGLGLAPRPDVFPQPPDRGEHDHDSEATPIAAGESGNSPGLPAQVTLPPRSEHPTFHHVDASSTNRHFHSQPSLSNDVFFGLPADDEDMDSEPLVLDRGILDWAFETTRTNAQDTANGKGDGVSLPRAHSGNPQPPSNPANTGNGAAALPSLASITAANDNYDQLELPSLMQYFPSIDGDVRTGGHGYLPGEELLGQS